MGAPQHEFLIRPPLTDRVRVWAVTYGAAVIWMLGTLQLPADLPLALSVGWLAAPAVLSLVVSATARSRWHRWAVLWALFFVTTTDYAPVVLAAGSAWVISDAWILARTFKVVRPAEAPGAALTEPKQVAA